MVGQIYTKDCIYAIYSLHYFTICNDFKCIELNYSKIAQLQKQNKVSNRKISRHLGMSDVGFAKMIENETCTVSTLEAIAGFFNKSVDYFFDREEKEVTVGVDQATEPRITTYSCSDCISKQKEIDALRSALEAKEELLEMYRDKKNEGKCG